MKKEEKIEDNDEQDIVDDKLNEEDQLKDLINLLKRNQAEFDNFRKRTEKERSDLIKLANKNLLVKLLPLVDNFELALQSKECSEEFVKGIELIYAQMIDLLDNQGVKKIQAKGNKFDPYFHEALLTVDEDGVDNDIVVEELQKGYTINDQVIRHSKVKINKKEAKDD